MHSNELTQLRDQLALKEQQLSLLFAMDHLRDTLPEPAAMLDAMVTLLATRLPAEICLLALSNRDTEQLETRALYDPTQRPGLRESPLTSAWLAQMHTLADVTTWEKDTTAPATLAGLHLAVAPLTMGDHERLGLLLVGRAAPAFTERERVLLQTARSQLDSAIIQGYAHQKLQQRLKELETIYRIDNLRDQNLPFPEMLQVVLQEVRQAIDSDSAFIMLYDRTGKQLELRATTMSNLQQEVPLYRVVEAIANDSLHQAELVCHNNLSQTLHAIACMPLILNERIIGVLGVLNHRKPDGFHNEARRLLRAIASQMDTAIFESLEQHRLRQVLGRSVDPRVMQRLLEHSNVTFLKGERCFLSVLYADIRGSTHLAEHTDPELLVGFINDYLGSMSEVILAHEGTIDKFVGDEVMALFGAPFPQPDHALRAIRVGLAMQVAHQRLITTWQARGVAATPIGIGIATGELIAGEMGCVQRAEYTVIGRAANLGARICGAALGGQVLVSQATYDLVRDAVEATPVTGLQFKGVGDDVTVYHITRVLE